MENLSNKRVRQIAEDMERIELGLMETVTADKFENYSNLAIDMSQVIEEVLNSHGLVERITELKTKGLEDVKKRYYLKKMHYLLNPKVELLKQKMERENPPMKDELLYSYENKGFRNASIERLEALKLQLELSTQKGFYLMQSNKNKVKAQEDILIIAAQIIQELSYETDLVKQIITKFQGLREYENISYVTESEEATIASCYVLLLESLLNLNYR